MSITNELSVSPTGGSVRRWSIAVLLTASIAMAPLSALANGDGVDMAKDAGIGAGTGIASLIYTPIKLTYALGGLIVGGLAWAFSGGDSEVASIVLTPSIRGDYVVTRSQLLGKQEIEFFGRNPEYAPDNDWDAVRACGQGPAEFAAEVLAQRELRAHLPPAATARTPTCACLRIALVELVSAASRIRLLAALAVRPAHSRAIHFQCRSPRCDESIWIVRWGDLRVLHPDSRSRVL